MLKVNKKKSEPEEFTKYKSKHKIINWDSFTTEIKQVLKQYLLEEQENSCCPYCEIEIHLEDSHIEHIMQKDKFPKLLADYNNFIACCLEKKICGDSKASKWSELFINPVIEDPEDYFEYDIKTGRMVPIFKEGEKYENVKDALEKLQVNDAAFNFEPETSKALGFGFRCGFLGLLHMEIIVERLEREFNLAVITTSPSVIYKVIGVDGSETMVQNPSNLPDLTTIKHLEEPIVKADIMIPKEYVGNIMEICQDRRGKLLHMEYITEDRVQLHYEMPLNEVIYDFFDALKSKTRGYGSLDYEFVRYEPSKLVKMDILLNKELVDAFSMIVHESKAYQRGKFVCEKLKEVIPMHQFEVPIQASIGQKVIARATVRAYRKDVIAKCYGGDISRKKKLLEKQKEGKKRMRQFGRVEVPQEAFTAVLKYDENK